MMTSFIPHKYNDSNSLKKHKPIQKAPSNVSSELHAVTNDRKIKSAPSEMCRRRTLMLRRLSLGACWGFTLRKYGLALQEAFDLDSLSVKSYASSCHSSIPEEIMFDNNSTTTTATDDISTTDNNNNKNDNNNDNNNKDDNDDDNNDDESEEDDDNNNNNNESNIDLDQSSLSLISGKQNIDEVEDVGIYGEESYSFKEEDEEQEADDDKETEPHYKDIHKDMLSLSFKPIPVTDDDMMTLPGGGGHVNSMTSRSLYTLNGRLIATKAFSYVDHVDHKGVADKAGLRKGDIILSVNGECVQDVGHDALLSVIDNQQTSIRLIVLYEACSRRIELYTQYMKLKRLLSEQIFQLRSLENQERGILQGDDKQCHSLRRQSLTNSTSVTLTTEYDRLSLQTTPGGGTTYLKNLNSTPINRAKSMNRFISLTSPRRSHTLQRSPTDPSTLLKRHLSSPFPGTPESPPPGRSPCASLPLTPGSSEHGVNDSGYVACRDLSSPDLGRIRRRLSVSSWSLSLDRMRVKSKSYLSLSPSMSSQQHQPQNMTLERPAKRCAAHKKKRCSLCDADTLVEGRSSWFIGPALMFNPSSCGYSTGGSSGDYEGVIAEGDEMTRL